MIVPMAELQTGMILLREVRDMSGRLLLGKGEAITDRHLRIFRAWGVAEADVQEPKLPDTPVEEAPPQEVEPTFDPRIRALFKHADLTHPFMKQLHLFSQEIPWSSKEEGVHGH